jgi:hypothetical protein
MKKVELKAKYQLVSGDSIVIETTSLPKMAKHLGCALSLFYIRKPKDVNEPWVFRYKGYEYQINRLG